MKCPVSRLRSVLMLLLALAGMALGGCATESENMSERPWDAPKSWENGMPSNMLEGR